MLATMDPFELLHNCSRSIYGILPRCVVRDGPPRGSHRLVGSRSTSLYGRFAVPSGSFGSSVRMSANAVKCVFNIDFPLFPFLTVEIIFC